MILIILTLLIFREIIEVNLFNLQYNTKRNIEKRAIETTESDIKEENIIEYEEHKLIIDIPDNEV